MTSLPYVPTSLFSSRDLVYILRPVGLNTGLFEFAALNLTNGFETSSLDLDTLLSPLPFSDDKQNTVIIPAQDDRDNIYVYTGDCKDGGEGATLWQFTPSLKSLNGNGTWQEVGISASTNDGPGTLSGANYLAAAGCFAASTNSTSSMFIFGGMCPTMTEVNASDWVSSADYSNTMLSAGSASSSTISVAPYQLTLSPSRGGPIAEAGFTMTALAPTFSNVTDGGIRSQNQKFVLIGGHTSLAFLNMSQIALFSLPEQSWSFVPVDQPPGSRSTDLAVRDINAVDPRSGHTAILTADGKRIIVIGGWVGDVSNPASPQVLELELGTGYGGVGDWQWTIPQLSGSGLSSGSGLYGHGATLIAKDVILISGGYSIPPSNGSKGRRTTPALSTQNYLFNTTSHTWMSSFTRPKNQDHTATTDISKGGQSRAERAGLGVGLTLGILAAMIAIAFFLWYSKRLKRRREARDEELRKLAAGAHQFHLSHPSQATPHAPAEMVMARSADDDPSRHSNAYPWNMIDHTQSTSQRAASEAERTGLLYEIPSPTRGLRRSLHSRATYQPAPRFEDGRRVAGLSTIQTIDERDEYDDPGIRDGAVDETDALHSREYRLLSNVPVLDPFRDPSEHSRTPSPQSPQEREAEVRGWVDDWTAANNMLHGGRLSPEKTDRTSSTLSDQSARSLLSHSSMQQSVGTISRTVSQRSTAPFVAAPLRPLSDPFVQDQPINSAAMVPAAPPYRHGHRRSRSLGLSPAPHQSKPSEAAKIDPESFPRLQFEGEALLGEYAGSEDPSPTKIQKRARNWMGSVRRALTGTDRSASTSPEHGASASSSPTKRGHEEQDLPRRAASTGGIFWQKRQGARDWDSDVNMDTRSRADELDGDEADWDVESAVERRVVQVMFTVPKEKLRVVNQGPEEDSQSAISARCDDARSTHERDVDGEQDRNQHPDADTDRTGNQAKGKEKET